MLISQCEWSLCAHKPMWINISPGRAFEGSRYRDLGSFYSFPADLCVCRNLLQGLGSVQHRFRTMWNCRTLGVSAPDKQRCHKNLKKQKTKLKMPFQVTEFVPGSEQPSLSPLIDIGNLFHSYVGVCKLLNFALSPRFLICNYFSVVDRSHARGQKTDVLWSWFPVQVTFTIQQLGITSREIKKDKSVWRQEENMESKTQRLWQLASVTLFLPWNHLLVSLSPAASDFLPDSGSQLITHTLDAADLSGAEPGDTW